MLEDDQQYPPVIRSTDCRFFHDLKKVLKGYGRLRRQRVLPPCADGIFSF
jgi:hypothetical protein